jgi:hypothetical protein
MSEKIPLLDSYASWRLAEKNVEAAVRRGDLEREKAGKILKDARENYRNNNFNRLAEKFNAGYRETR